MNYTMGGIQLYLKYSDTTWNSSDDEMYVGDWIFTLTRGAISWKSKKQMCIARSTMESEFFALLSIGEETE